MRRRSGSASDDRRGGVRCRHHSSFPSVWARLRGDRKTRAAIQQVLLLAGLLWAGYEIIGNARANLQARGIVSGFGFLGHIAGFGVSQALIPYAETDSYGRIFLVGLLNTLLVAGLGIVLTTPLGFLIGIARLSRNFMVAGLAAAYVEITRNLPLLFHILFWYLAVLASLPPPRQSVSVLGFLFASNRGIIVPQVVLGAGAGAVATVLFVAIMATVLLRTWSRRRQDATGRRLPTMALGLGLIVGLPFVTAAVLGFPVSFERPQLHGFNFVGGYRVIPEFVALLVALVTYTAGFIAEIVRAGVLAVPRGQTEAAYSLGLRPATTLRHVVVPQALRVIIPPLAGQYLNLTKNSSLGVAIGYPDLVAVFAGTALNQTGQAIEILGITMLVYLAISLLTSLLMNWFNARMQLVEG
jgi:general L-amino acid transport system permease protein